MSLSTAPSAVTTQSGRGLGPWVAPSQEDQRSPAGGASGEVSIEKRACFSGRWNGGCATGVLLVKEGRGGLGEGPDSRGHVGLLLRSFRITAWHDGGCRVLASQRDAPVRGGATEFLAQAIRSTRASTGSVGKSVMSEPTGSWSVSATDVTRCSRSTSARASTASTIE